ncbi:MAG: HAMP domain-containing sensor histidine kinase [Hyphomicrobiaceae bacterium]|nr:HAMP domain-containing sensor histidine kinase [Hyphomicrobiaceae bacterium]
MGEYAALVGDAVLRQRARIAEQDARVQSELVNKIRSEFLANMSHELRTPLNTVMGFSKMMMTHDTRPLKDHEIIEYAGIIHEAASHLLSVINDILDISKIQAGRFVLDQRDVELDEILRTCILSFRPLATQAGLTLVEEIAGDLRPTRGDPGKLNQVFNNILSNAIKFTPHGGTVTLSATNLMPDRVSVTIRDTGIGMNAEDIAVAMTPFGQVDGSRTRWREGTGLGLPIAHSLTQMHEGEINIRSKPGAGTEVTVLLPSSTRISLAEARETLMAQTGA